MVQYDLTGLIMDWIDQNLDAYRVIAEILTELRPLVRERIETRHGKEWFRDGIPESVFENLIRNKEQEASIDWYENRYQEVISYAVFPDLIEIIMANPGLFDPILKLAPGQSLLNTRFLELEVMRSKIGRARQVSETEINFLTSFHLRFRRAVQEMKGLPVEATIEGATPTEAAGGFSGQLNTPATKVSADPRPPAKHESIPEAGTSDEGPAAADSPPAPDRPPQRMASARTEAEAEPAVEFEVEPEGVAEVDAGAVDDDGNPKQRETIAAILKRAMETNDDQTVLREVYREVTGIAEVIWTTEEIPTTVIWDRISTNPWYEASFSRLELRPLSDFYELISQVRAKRKSGTSKAEIQSFLNDSKFATTLLALRDMFQKVKI